MSFDEVVHWLDNRLSRPVQVTVAGPPTSRGNSGSVLRGALGPGPDDFGLVDARPGRLAQWAVGRGASFSLLEGDLLRAEVEDGMLLIETHELQINVAVEE